MSRSASVRLGVPDVHGGGADSSPLAAEPPSVHPLLRELSDGQLMAVAFFNHAHDGHPDVEICPVRDESLTVPVRIDCYCPCCGEARTYHRESGSPEGGDTPA